MAKKKRNQKNKESHYNRINSEYDTESISVKKIIIIILVFAAIFGVFYLLTIGILNKKDKKTSINNASIQYTEILAGESFTQNKSEYLVFFYDSSKEDVDTNHTLISNYRDKKDALTMYTVDMHEGLNKNYRSDSEDNNEATSASELKISKTTIIHIKKGKIVEYINENIEEYLK